METAAGFATAAGYMAFSRIVRGLFYTGGGAYIMPQALAWQVHSYCCCISGLKGCQGAGLLPDAAVLARFVQQQDDWDI
jgi:hypothetical protein